MIVEKKIWPKYFRLILDGKKSYEFRIADFECNEGDQLLLKEWDPDIKKYTGREITKNVTYVGKFKIDELSFSIEDINKYGFQIISLK